MNRLPDAWPCISLREPWLWAVLHLDKRIENRRWWASRRGPIWLQRSSNYSARYCAEALRWMRARGLVPDGVELPDWRVLPAPGLVGCTEIDGVLPPTDGLFVTEFDARAQIASFRSNIIDADEVLRWKMSDQFGFVLKNTRAIQFIAHPGKQRWFYLPPDIERRARAALASRVEEVAHG